MLGEALSLRAYLWNRRDIAFIEVVGDSHQPRHDLTGFEYAVASTIAE